MKLNDLNTDVRLPDRRRALELVVVTVFVAAIIPFVAFAVPQLAGADHSYVVLSSSMSPTMSAGSAVFVEEVPPKAVEEGDVITFRQRASVAAQEDDGTNLVTHRVVEVVFREDGRYFRTKGDANEDPDSWLVPAEALVGTAAFSIPVLGQLIVYAGSPYGIVALVIVPMALLAASELYDLLGAYRAEKRADNDEDSRTAATDGGDGTSGFQFGKRADRGHDHENGDEDEDDDDHHDRRANSPGSDSRAAVIRGPDSADHYRSVSSDRQTAETERPTAETDGRTGK